LHYFCKIFVLMLSKWNCLYSF